MRTIQQHAGVCLELCAGLQCPNVALQTQQGAEGVVLVFQCAVRNCQDSSLEGLAVPCSSTDYFPGDRRHVEDRRREELE